MKHCAFIFALLTLCATAIEREELTALVRENKLEQAIALVEKELATSAEENTPNRAQLFSYQGELLLKMQRPESAAESFAQCLKIREAISATPQLMLETHLRMARALLLTPQSKQAVASYEKAIALATSQRDNNTIFGLRAELAEGLLKMGDVTAAWKWLNAVPPQGLSDDVAIHWFSVRSKVSFASGSYAEAYLWLRDANQRWQKTSDQNPQIGLVLAMESCALAQRLNRKDEASAHGQDAKKLAQIIGGENLTASVRWSLAVLEAELSDAENMLIYQQMVEVFGRCKDDSEFVAMGTIISAQVKLASLALDAKEYAAAQQWCDQLDKRLPNVDSFRSLLHRYRAAAFFHQGQHEQAQHEAIESAKSGQRWLQRSRIFGLAENMIGLENSVDLISPLMLYTRPQDRAEIVQQCLLENHDAGLSQWIQLRRRLHQGPQRAAIRQLFLSETSDRTQNIVDQFQQWSKLYPHSEKVLDQLPESGALVHYFIYRNEKQENHYAAIVIQRDQPSRCVELGSADVIHSRVRALLTTSEKQATDAAYQGTSPLVLCDALHALLWSPLQIRAQEVIIRPAGMLQFVPWSILHQAGAAADAGYLCQQYRSLRVVACSQGLPKPPASSLSLSLLGVAAQQDVASGEQRYLVQGETFPDLPGVLREFAAIESTGLKPIHQNAKMTASAFRDPVVLSSSMLHISGHGFVVPSDDPLQDGAAVLRQSGLVFHDYGKREKGLLYVGDAAYLPLDEVHDVVLSLCRGGLSNHAGLENWSSLRRAFLAAGASHVAAAQWEIVDDDMQYFMRQLYAEIQSGTPLPAALQKTQCDWIEGKIPHAQKFSPAMRIATGGAWVVESAGW